MIIDGLCTDTLSCAHVCTHVDGLARGSYLSRKLQPQHPHSLLANLTSLLTSMPPAEHGILSNSGTARIAPHAVSLFSSLVTASKTSRPLCPMIGSWPSPQGALQTAMLINSQAIRNVDHELAEQAARHLQREKPDCCLLCLDGPNIAGTHFGFQAEPYMESLEQADQALGTILEHLRIVGAEAECSTSLSPGSCAAPTAVGG